MGGGTSLRLRKAHRPGQGATRSGVRSRAGPGTGTGAGKLPGDGGCGQGTGTRAGAPLHGGQDPVETPPHRGDSPQLSFQNVVLASPPRRRQKTAAPAPRVCQEPRAEGPGLCTLPFPYSFSFFLLLPELFTAAGLASHSPSGKLGREQGGYHWLKIEVCVSGNNK